MNAKIKRVSIEIDEDALRILKEIQGSLKYKASYSQVIRELKRGFDDSERD